MSVVVFCLFLVLQNISTKRSPNATKLFGDFFGPEDNLGAKEAPGGGPWGPQDTRVRRRPLARPNGLWGSRGSPPPPLSSINTQIFQKPQGSRRNTIPAAASSRTMRSNLEPYSGTLPEGNTITEGFIILIGDPPMMRE